MPLISAFELQPTPPYARARASSPTDDEKFRKPWTSYLPTLLTVFMLLAPHPSILKVLVAYYLVLQQSPKTFLIHLFVVYFLSFISFTCLIIVLARDPGPVDPIRAQQQEDAVYAEASGVKDDDSEETEGLSFTEALLRDSMSNNDGRATWLRNVEKRWCKKCWHPKPERCHHCSECGRCVLKMDHHCPWLASKCIGYRTYPAFVHLLLSVTLFASYTVLMMIPPIRYYLAFTTIIREDDTTPWHTLFIALMGMVFALMIGSFWIYHVYLISTNQSTLENIAPFMLLRYIPALPNTIPPPSPHTPQATSNAIPIVQPPYRSTPSPKPQEDPNSPYYFPSPPSNMKDMLGTEMTAPKPVRLVEHELTGFQRRMIRSAHGKIKIYDLGWKQNWGNTLGGYHPRHGKHGARWRWWLWLVFTGGFPKGDGYSFAFNPTTEKRLNRLASDLARTS